MPKKDDGSQHGSNKDGSVKSSVNAESSAASFSSNVEQDVTSNDKAVAVEDGQCYFYGLVVLKIVYNLLFNLV